MLDLAAFMAIYCTTTKEFSHGFTLLDNDSVKKIVSAYRLLARKLAFILRGSLIGLTLGFSQISETKTPAQKSNENRQKVTVQNTKSVGFKDKSVVTNSKTNSMSMSLNPSLFQKKSPDELMLNIDANLDYRVSQGCLQRSFFEGNLPASIGINNPQFSEFFKSQTKNFFEKMRGNCIPYAVAFTTRNKFDSLSIMNGPIQDSKTEVWTFTPSAFGGFLVQQDFLRNESKNLTEIRVPLKEVLYDPRKLGDKLPVELVWELNSIIKQIYPEANNSLENTNSIVRLIVDFGDREKWAQIWAAEIIDLSNKEVFASAFWVERNDIPGAFFTSNGESLEQSFWTNPLSYRRISRGVGMVRAGAPKRSKNNPAVTQLAPTKQRYRTHMGIDYAAPVGTPIFSVANGKVVHLGYSGAFGKLIVLEHPGGYHTYYAHLSGYNSELDVGNEIRRGLEIGYVGSTGRSTGPHLHFELRKNGIYVDPYATKTQLDLWSMRDSESGQLTREILLFGSPMSR